MRERFVRRWAAVPTQLRELRRGVADTRRGIAVMEDVVGGLEAPFASWKAHECEAAKLGVAKAVTPAPTGLKRINAGMLRLWRLANPPPPRTERRRG
ncbi:MAG: hypothetical protein J0H06_06165 [Actinobacteria bacterium]|nr:hypothetical protein [Actinomycetota bacterium]